MWVGACRSLWTINPYVRRFALRATEQPQLTHSSPSAGSNRLRLTCTSFNQRSSTSLRADVPNIFDWSANRTYETCPPCIGLEYLIPSILDPSQVTLVRMNSVTTCVGMYSTWDLSPLSIRRDTSPATWCRNLRSLRGGTSTKSGTGSNKLGTSGISVRSSRTARRIISNSPIAKWPGSEAVSLSAVFSSSHP